MPLPKPPAKKGDLLHSDEFEAQAAPRAEKRTLKTRAVEAPAPAALDLHDGGAALAARPAPVPALAAAPAPVAATRAPASSPVARARRPRLNRGTGPAKLFVLDTNVLMHDPMSLFRFEEHDVFLPMITLEELDGHKKGMSEVARSVFFKMSNSSVCLNILSH